MDKTIDFSSLKSEITADKVIDLARKHNDSETLNETLRRKGDIYERRNNYVSSEIWSDASAPSPGWGKKDDEDDWKSAHRCAQMAHAMCKPKPRSRSFHR